MSPNTIAAAFLTILIWDQVSGQSENVIYTIDYDVVSDCITTPGEVFHEFYDLSHLSCTQCRQNTTYQTVSQDGLFCVCQEGSRLTQDFGGANISCEACPDGQSVSDDGWGCVVCETNTADPGLVPCPACPQNLQVTVERDLDGSWLVTDEGEAAKICVTCQNDTAPSSDARRCSRCNQVLSVQDQGCECPDERLSGGLCFASVEHLEPSYTSLYEISFSGVQIESSWLRTNLRAAHSACAPDYNNLTACQSLGNMCVMLMYTASNQPPNPQMCDSVPCNNACSLHMRFWSDYPDNRLPSHQEGSWGVASQWRETMPWLFYPANTGQTINKDPNLPVIFTEGSSLDIVVAKYTVEGAFVEFIAFNSSGLLLCPSSDDQMEHLFLLGRSHKIRCRVSVDNLYDGEDYATYYYDPYLVYTEETTERLYPIPVLIRNIAGNSQDSNMDDWQYVRRLYAVDRVAGVQQVEGTGRAEVLRYLSNMVLHISLRDGSTDGSVYVPYLEVTYSQVRVSLYGQGASVWVSYGVEYTMSLSEFSNDLSIAIGVLSAVAVLYAFFLTSNWNRREGKVAIEFVSIAKLVLFAIGSLANAFFIVTLGFSAWWFIMTKGQNVLFLVPSRGVDYYLTAYLASAFSLKVVQLIHVIGVQCSVDIFFLDWERPGRDLNKNDAVSHKTQDVTKISIWRTMFLANQWNELQTKRRINPVIQLLLLMLLLEGAGLENLARSDMSASLELDESRGEFSQTLRFIVSAACYIGLGLVQAAFYTIFWTRFKQEDVDNFVDLCSMSNISVFIMTNNNFGYYVHGRSVHGKADVGLRGMHEAVHREEENLCGERGLMPGSDEQTFEIALPRRLRQEYNKVLTEVRLTRAKRRTRGAGVTLDDEKEQKLQAYGVLNKFLQNFIDHNQQGLEYIVTKKSLFERALDTEIEDSSQVGYFYSDYGHSFDKTLFFGNEAMLQVFDILLFSIVDLAAQNYVLAAIITYLMQMIISKLRSVFGERNLTEKTMIDERFL